MYDKDNTSIEMTSEEEQEYYRENEKDFLESLLEAADFVTDEVKEIQIIRKGTVAFSFRVHTLSEEEVNDIRKKYTKYAKNKRNGVRVAEEVDTAKYRSSLIYNSTIDEDKKKIWDNRTLWKALEAKGRVIINALDVINTMLLPGEKDRIIDTLDDLNGYNSEISSEETAKN